MFSLRISVNFIMIRNERFSNIIYILSLRMKTRDRSLGNALFFLDSQV